MNTGCAEFTYRVIGGMIFIPRFTMSGNKMCPETWVVVQQ